MNARRETARVKRPRRFFANQAGDHLCAASVFSISNPGRRSTVEQLRMKALLFNMGSEFIIHPTPAWCEEGVVGSVMMLVLTAGSPLTFFSLV